VLPASENADPPNFWSLYRWHIQDPINFARDLRVTIQALGWGADGKYKKMADDIASVAFWYQAEPHQPFPRLPALAERVRDAQRAPLRLNGALEMEALPVRAHANDTVVQTQDLRPYGHGWSQDAHLFVQAHQVGDFVEVVIPAKDATPRKLVLYTTRANDYGQLRFLVNGKKAGSTFDGYAERPAPSGPMDLGVHEPQDGQFVLRAEVVGCNAAATGARYYFGLDAVVLQ